MTPGGDVGERGDAGVGLLACRCTTGITGITAGITAGVTGGVQDVG
jgi:hypothetical protein